MMGKYMNTDGVAFRKAGLALVCFFSLATGFGQTRYSLKQCVDLALQNNLQVQQTALQVENNAVALHQSRTNLLPNLNGNLGFGFNQGRNLDPITNVYINQELLSSGLSLNSNLVVFNGMRLQNLILQNKYNHEASKLDLQQTKDNLALNVILTYLQVLSSEDQLEMGKSQLSVTKSQLERAENQVKEGAAGQFLVTDLRGQMANEQINLMNLENSLRQSKLALCQLMRIEMNLDLSLERLPEATLLPYEKSASAVYTAARENMAVFKSNGLKVKAMDKGLHVARSGFMPTVSLTGNLGSSYSSLSNRFIPTGSSEEETGQFVRFQGTESPVLVNQTHYNSEKIGYSRQMKNNLGVFAGVSLQVPVFNGFYASNQVRLAKLNQKRAMLDLETNEQQMKQNIEQAWLLMDMAWRKQDLIRQQVSDFETSFQAAKTRLENGVISAAEFLIAKNNADRSRLSGVQATYEYQFRTRILDYYQGKLGW